MAFLEGIKDRLRWVLTMLVQGEPSDLYIPVLVDIERELGCMASPIPGSKGEGPFEKPDAPEIRAMRDCGETARMDLESGDREGAIKYLRAALGEEDPASPTT